MSPSHQRFYTFKFKDSADFDMPESTGIEICCAHLHTDERQLVPRGHESWEGEVGGEGKGNKIYGKRYGWIRMGWEGKRQKGAERDAKKTTGIERERNG